MKTNVDLDQYVIYNDIEANLHVAIPKKNIPAIEIMIRTFRNVEHVPDDKLTTGIYLENTTKNEFNMVNKRETEIKIKNLRFDNL